MDLYFKKIISALIAILVFTSLTSTFKAVSQIRIAFNDNALTVVTPDSLSLPDTLPTFSNLGHFCSPIRGKVISHFGPRHQRFHAGTDINLHLGDSVRAAFTGVVTRATRYYGYGLLVVLNHGSNVETFYSHLSKILVNVGDTIPVGKIIGLGGRTGRATCTHLHFELRVNHIAYNSELLFDFGKQLVLNNSIPTRDSIPLKNSTPTKDSIPNYDGLNIDKNIVKSNQPNNNEIYHIVVKNDTIYSLARHYGSTINRICSINQIDPNAILKIGQSIKVR